MTGAAVDAVATAVGRAVLAAERMAVRCIPTPR
jgi:hypothetical protein